MPLKLGKAPYALIFTGHRNDNTVLKRKAPQAKDADQGDLPPQSLPPRKEERFTSIPRISISLMNHSTKYHSPAKAREAVRNVETVFDDFDGLAAHCKGEVRQKLADARTNGKQVMIVIGEDHGSPASFVAQMAALSAIGDEGGDPSTFQAALFIESGAGELEDRQALIGNLSTQLKRGSTDPLKDYMAAESVSPEDSNSRLLREFESRTVAYCAAQQAGFDLVPTDPLHDDEETDIYRREAAMMAAMETYMSSHSGPFIVVIGADHAAAIHEKFLQQTNMVCMVPVKEDDMDTSLCRKRTSYALSHPQVTAYRTTAGFDATKIDYHGLANGLGLRLFPEEEGTAPH